MSIWIELAGFLGGALGGYAEKDRWSKLKMFFAMSCSSFALFAAYVMPMPASKGIWVGISLAGVYGSSMGLWAVLLMWFSERYKSRRPNSQLVPARTLDGLPANSCCKTEEPASLW